MKGAPESPNSPAETGKVPAVEVRRWLVELAEMREIRERMEEVTGRHNAHIQNLSPDEKRDGHPA
jgi:hypothetical protein